MVLMLRALDIAIAHCHLKSIQRSYVSSICNSKRKELYEAQFECSPHQKEPCAL